MPASKLLLLPPLLVKTARLLKLPAVVGAKATCTKPVWPGARLKELPFWIAKGGVVLTAPLSVWPPRLISWKLRLLVWPIITAPKLRLAGLRARRGAGLVTAM